MLACFVSKQFALVAAHPERGDGPPRGAWCNRRWRLPSAQRRQSGPRTNPNSRAAAATPGDATAPGCISSNPRAGARPAWARIRTPIGPR